MEWINRLNDTITYIEEHLTDKIDYEQLGRIACCSSYHFQRMFTYMAGIPLSEYIRRRRMSLAAVDFQSRGSDTMDGLERTVKCGWGTVSVFSGHIDDLKTFAL